MRKKNPDVASFCLPICFFSPPQLLRVSLESLKYTAFLKSLKSLFAVASFYLLTCNLDKDQISICSGEAHKMRKQTWDSGYLFVNTRIERMQVGTLVLEPSAWILSRSHIFRVMAETLGEAVSSSPTDISICRCCTHTQPEFHRFYKHCREDSIALLQNFAIGVCLQIHGFQSSRGGGRRRLHHTYLELLDITDAHSVSLETVIQFETTIQYMKHTIFCTHNDLATPTCAAHHFLLQLLRHCRLLLLEELELPPLVHLFFSLPLDLILFPRT